MERSWPRKTRSSRPEDSSQSFSVLSQLLDSTNLPSGEIATDATPLACPSKDRRMSPVDSSKSCSEPLLQPERANWPSGEGHRGGALQVPLEGDQLAARRRLLECERLVAAAGEREPAITRKWCRRHPKGL